LISIITGPLNESSSIGRLEGYKAALSDNGIFFNQANVFEGDWTKRNSQKITAKILERNPRPTAIFAFNNSMSLGALITLKTQNIIVPDDIALVSFDDVENGDLLCPALTTTNTSWYELGLAASKLLLERITQERKGPHKTINLPVDIVIRESCGSKIKAKL
jgi:LacI family transcriptional regulator